MLHPDQKYIDALLSNNKVLIEELYEKYFEKIKLIVLQNNGNETDAADVFQEILLVIFKKAKSEKFTLTCPLDAYLNIVCKNKWMNELRKRKLYKVTINRIKVSNIDKDSFTITDESILNSERKSLLNEKLGELCKDCRQLLQLNWSGKTIEEVAGLLNITYGYARKKKCECMAQLITLIKHSSKFNSLKW